MGGAQSSTSNLPHERQYVASDLELVLQATEALERLLATRFGALGPDLASMILAVQPRLSAHALRALRYVSNAHMHVLCSQPQPRLTPCQKARLGKAPPLDRKMFMVHFEYAVSEIQSASSPPKQRRCGLDNTAVSGAILLRRASYDT